MKSVFILVFSLAFFFNPVFSQQKLDYVWPLGYGPETHPPSGIVQGGILMDFNDNPPSLSLHSFISESQKAGICGDSTGQLLAYTDGCNIYNREHTIMLNGDSLNPGKVFDEFCSSFPSYPLYQGCLFLPKPGGSDTFYLLHLRDDDWLWNPMDLMYSIIDAKGDTGKGEVITKNQVVFSDSIWLGNYISATRHANGQDWWVVVPQRVRPGFHVSLLTSQGMEYKGLQIFGDSTYQVFGGQTAFSPDGSKYFRHWPEGLLVLGFDRCTGIFSNLLYIDYSDFPAGGGVAVSRSGRFLYVSKGYRVYQYDLSAADIVASKITVAEYDGFVSPFPTYFSQAMLAPNGKIYVTAGTSNNVLHVIHNPDSLGLACNVEQHGVQLPAITDFLIPNYANYRLYDLPGSPCDTLGINTPVAAKEPGLGAIKMMSITPNPASDLLTLRLTPEENGLVTVTDLTGKILLTATKRAGYEVIEFNTSSLLSGIYFVSFQSDSGLSITRKLVVQH